MADPLRFPPPPLAGPSRRGPLGPLAARLAEVPRALCFEEVPFPGQLRVQARGDDDLVRAAVAGVLGVAPPEQPGTVARGEDVEVLACPHVDGDPDGWLVVTPGGREEVLYRRLHQAVDGLATAVTDVTDACAVFHLAGPLAREVLAKGGFAGVLAPGFCVTTQLERMPVLLQQIDDRTAERQGAPPQPCFRVYVAASLARRFVTWVLDAVAEH